MGDFFLLGAGGIGRRYLESCAQLQSPLGIHIYDRSINQEQVLRIAHDLLPNSPHKFTTYSDLDFFLDRIKNDSLVSLATYADTRLELSKKILKKRPRLLVLEKPLCQRLEDFNELLELEKIATTDIRCNLSAHFQPYFYRLKNQIKPSSIINMEIIDTNSGIACVGVHYFDLFCWLLSIDQAQLENIDIDEEYLSKRASFYDIRGRVRFTSKDSSLSFTNIENQETERIRIKLEKKVIEFDFLNNKDQLNHYEVSQYYHKIIEFGLGQLSHCPLPTIQESKSAHLMLYQVLKKAGLEELNFT